MTVIQRLVFPAEADPDVLPLYAEGKPGRATVGPRGKAQILETPGQESIAQVLGRNSYRVPRGHRTSFATYFNAFPAAYWARHTTVTQVRLRVEVSGHGMLVVSRSNARGHGFRIHSQVIESDQPLEVVFDLPLDTFGDGGWYWWDAVAADTDLTIHRGQWETDASARCPEGKAQVAICTFNRPADCVANLGQLAEYDALSEYVSEILVVDQGDRKVRDEAGFVEVAEKLGNLLRIVDQPNLGGSGGFSRGMYEAMRAGADYVLLLDDDVRVEPEGICRAVQFANMCHAPTIVGGHMFSMYQRTELHAFAEGVDIGSFWWRPAEGTETEHDFAAQSLRATPWLHERAEADYNGWWMCLIPTQVVQEIGLSLPLFIKWDDSEYGVRAQKAGYRTVSFPGAALWHIPWTAKDDSLDWQAYFHARNRLIAALLHTSEGGSVPRASLIGQIKHLVSLQYSVAELRDQAIRDVLAGPGNLHAELTTKIPQIRQIRAQFSDSQIRPSADDFPPPTGPRLAGETVRRRAKAHPLRKAIIGVNGLRKQLMPGGGKNKAPQTHISFPAARWWTLSQYDSALVSNSDGSGVSLYVRDRDTFTRQLRQTYALHRQLQREWPRLATEYQAAAAELVSPQQWAHTFGIDHDSGIDQTPGTAQADATSRSLGE